MQQLLGRLRRLDDRRRSRPPATTTPDDDDDDELGPRQLLHGDASQTDQLGGAFSEFGVGVVFNERTSVLSCSVSVPIDTEVAYVTRDSDTTFRSKGQISTCSGRGHIVAASRTACLSLFYVPYVNK